MGLVSCPIQHVLRHQTEGSWLFHEEKTAIVALMRGEERINDAFPLGIFVQAKEAEKRQAPSSPITARSDSGGLSSQHRQIDH